MHAIIFIKLKILNPIFNFFITINLKRLYQKIVFLIIIIIIILVTNLVLQYMLPKDKDYFKYEFYIETLNIIFIIKQMQRENAIILCIKLIEDQLNFNQFDSNNVVLIFSFKIFYFSFNNNCNNLSIK